MNLRKSEVPLTDDQVDKGLKLVLRDGLADEALVVLTQGTFLVSLALSLGASNVQIGILAGLPTFSNIFQLVSIYLVQKYKARKGVTTIGNFLARFPIFIIGALPLLFSQGTSIQVLMFFLALHYIFGNVAGASWNSWMKDLIPEQRLGTFFGNRLRATQTLNVIMSLTLALILDYIKEHHPETEQTTYALMFIAGGIIGVYGSWLLSRTPEPPSDIQDENLMQTFLKPLRDKNFRNLLTFNAAWAFALNIAVPFFTVFLLKSVGLKLSWVIGLTILGQLSGIASIRLWGRFSDTYSNKTIIRAAAPLYILCIFGWSFVTVPSALGWQIVLIAMTQIVSGSATAGINMALINIGLKLAPRESSIAYISVKNMSVAFISALAPLIGGYLADYFSDRYLILDLQWSGPKKVYLFNVIELNNWNFLFIIGGALAWIALASLRIVQEQGEVSKEQAVREMRVIARGEFKKATSRKALINYVSTPVLAPIKFGKKVIHKQQQLQARLFGGSDGTAPIK